jgi:molecular chaperone DnaK
MTVIQFRKRNAEPAPGEAHADGASTIAKPPRGARAIGIDLGTTNSVVSLYTPNKSEPETLLYDDLPMVPSVLYFDEELGREVVGHRAWKQLEEHPEAIVRGTKRSMGSVARNFFSGNRAYSPEEAATRVLGYLAEHPALKEEQSQNGNVWAVVTVPAHFDDAARRSTIQAASSAGIQVLRIVNEPTAAALAYSMLPDVRQRSGETLAVFDFGGGTFDVSIVERDGLVFNVLASEGDIFLGGDDIDAAFANHLLQFVKPVLSARRAKADSPLFKKLLHLAEGAKIEFESKGKLRIYDDDLDGRGACIDVELTRDVLEDLAAPFVQRTLELTERAMHAAKRRHNQISRILLVGGSTRLALVRRMLTDYFPACQVDGRLEPDLAVSWGAAVQAAIILGIEPDTILVDVCSHSLGIGVAEDSAAVNENFKRVARKFGILPSVTEAQLEQILGDRLSEFNHELQSLLHVAPIIHRNSPLPARRSEFFSTLYANQLGVHVVVVQGEGDTVGENRLIGSFLFELTQPCAKGARCEIQLTYDVNGMVHVLAKQLDTDNEAEAQFDSRTGEVIGWRHISHLDQTGIGTAPESEIPMPVLNGLIARTRRLLEQENTGGDASTRAQAEELLGAYEKLLADARVGAANDAEVEFIEERLVETLERFDRD